MVDIGNRSVHNSELDRLKKRLNAHLINEMEICKDILEAGLSEEKWRELILFIDNHPHAKLVRELPERLRRLRNGEKTT